MAKKHKTVKERVNQPKAKRRREQVIREQQQVKITLATPPWEKEKDHERSNNTDD